MPQLQSTGLAGLPLAVCRLSGGWAQQLQRASMGRSLPRSARTDASPSAPQKNKSFDAEQHILRARGYQTEPLRVEDLTPEHWRQHLDTLKLGEQAALRRYIEIVARINVLREHMARMSDEQLAAKTGELRQRLLEWERGGVDASSSRGSGRRCSGSSSRSSLPWPFRGSRRRQRQPALLGGMPEDVVVEAFAVVREAAHRVLGMRHYDVQLIGGLVLHEGQVAEMKTGEGKTLVATLPAYVNALTGRGVHVVTVNGYLARRDADWIGKVFTFLGLSVGVVTETSTVGEKIEHLQRDITYLTARDLAFTYLHDNTATLPSDIAIRRPLHYAVLDEVDSILIDEAANPFIICATFPEAASQATKFRIAAEIALDLHPKNIPAGSEGWTDEEWQKWEAELEQGGRKGADVTVRAKFFQANLTRRGMAKAVKLLAQRGLVQLASDGTGRMAVVLKSPTMEAGCTVLAITFVDMPNSSRAAAAAGKVAGGGNSSAHKGGTGSGSGRMSLTEEVWVPGSSMEAVAAELKRRGLTPLPTPPSDAELRAALPAALWSGERAWGTFLTLSCKAQWCYQKNVHYLLRDRKVVLVDVPTGRERTMSVLHDGLHQAVEAKEDVPVTAEMGSTSTISFQALFGYYSKLAGMTGTAATELMELGETYRLNVIRVPPHCPNVRVDHPLRCFYFAEGKKAELWRLVKEAQEQGQPVLIGTGSVQESEMLVSWLGEWLMKGFGTRINLLNARPERTRFEAQIIAQAGLPQAVTVATNLAGRGTDILLGGNPKGLVVQLLEVKLLELMAAGAPDLDASLPPTPLAGLDQDFIGEREMRLTMRPLLFDAWLEAKQQLALAVQEQEGVAAAGAAPVPSCSPLPWRCPGSKQPAADAANWLSGVVEAAEVQRAHLKLNGSWVHQGPLETALKEADVRIWRYRQEQDEARQHNGTVPATGQAARTEAALLRFVLLQWIWFDRRCKGYAEEVKAAGGLRVILAAVPDSRRSELQLRGRAGRQGDPGETHLVLSMEDPVLTLLFKTDSPSSFQSVQRKRVGISPNLHSRMPSTETILYMEDQLGLSHWCIRNHITSIEEHNRKGREVVRDFDKVMEQYRYEVYRLRHRILSGGSGARHALLHRAFQYTAVAMVARLVDASQPPSHWPLLLLMRHVHALVNTDTDKGLEPTVDFQGRLWQVNRAAGFAVPCINLHPEETAAALLAALDSGGKLPVPPLLPDVAAGQVEGPPGGAATPAAPPQQYSSVSLQLRERQQLFALRRRLLREESTQAAAAAATAAASADPGAPQPPSLEGRYGAAAQRLAIWLAEYLAVQYRNKRALLKWWWINEGAMEPTTRLHVEGVVATCERDTLLARLDGLWSDFLADTTRVQSLVTIRAYSQFDPRQEYALESADLFARLLQDFKVLSTLDVFGGVAEGQLVAASRTSAQELEAADAAETAENANVAAESTAVKATAAAAGGPRGTSAQPQPHKPGADVAADYDAADLVALFDRQPELRGQLEAAVAEQAQGAADAQEAAAVSVAAVKQYTRDVEEAEEAVQQLASGLAPRLEAALARSSSLLPDAQLLLLVALREFSSLGPLMEGIKEGPAEVARVASLAADEASKQLRAAVAVLDVSRCEAAAEALKDAVAAMCEASEAAGARLLSMQARSAAVHRKLDAVEGPPGAAAAELKHCGGGGSASNGTLPTVGGTGAEVPVPGGVGALALMATAFQQFALEQQQQQQGRQKMTAPTDLPSAVLGHNGGNYGSSSNNGSSSNGSGNGSINSSAPQQESSAVIDAAIGRRPTGGQEHLQQVTAAVYSNASSEKALDAVVAVHQQRHQQQGAEQQPTARQ